MAEALTYPPIPSAISNQTLEIAGAGYQVCDPSTTDVTRLSKIGVTGFYFVYGGASFQDRGQCLFGTSTGHIRYYDSPPGALIYNVIGGFGGTGLGSYPIPTSLVPHEVHGFRTYADGSIGSTGRYSDVSTAQFVKAGPLAVLYDTKGADNNPGYLWAGPYYSPQIVFYYGDGTLNPQGWTEGFYIGDQNGTLFSDYPAGFFLTVELSYLGNFLNHAYEYAAGFSIGYPSQTPLADNWIAGVPSDGNQYVPPQGGQYANKNIARQQSNETDFDWNDTVANASGGAGSGVPYRWVPHDGAYSITHYGNASIADPKNDPQVTLTVGGNAVGVLNADDSVFSSGQVDYYNPLAGKPPGYHYPNGTPEQPTVVRFVCRQKHTHRVVADFVNPEQGTSFPLKDGTADDDYWVGKLLFAYLDLDPDAGKGVAPPPDAGKGKNTGRGVDMVSHRAGFYVADDAQGITVTHAPNGYQPFDYSAQVDDQTDCRLPQLLMQQEGEGVVCVYRRGTGKKADPNTPGSKDDPYRIFRRTSYDYGKTWVKELDTDGNEQPVMQDVKWFRQLNMIRSRSRDRLEFYNDASGTDKDGKPDGTGLLVVDIYDESNNFVGTFPEDGQGIAGVTADDAMFDVERVGDYDDIRIVFLSGGSIVYALSVDEGRTWKDISDQFSTS